jgi:hypothetical protein
MIDQTISAAGGRSLAAKSFTAAATTWSGLETHPSDIGFNIHGAALWLF